MGHDEIPYLLFGATKASGGSVSVTDKPLVDLTPDHAIAAKVAFLPADRHRQSGIPNATVLENVVMTNGFAFCAEWLRAASRRADGGAGTAGTL